MDNIVVTLAGEELVKSSVYVREIDCSTAILSSTGRVGLHPIAFEPMDPWYQPAGLSKSESSEVKSKSAQVRQQLHGHKTNSAVVSVGMCSTAPWMPSAGDTFQISWLQHSDRSYLEDFFTCEAADGECVVARMIGATSYRARPYVFRRGDVAFTKPSEQVLDAFNRLTAEYEQNN